MAFPCRSSSSSSSFSPLVLGGWAFLVFGAFLFPLVFCLFLSMDGDGLRLKAEETGYPGVLAQNDIVFTFSYTLRSTTTVSDTIRREEPC